MTHDFGSAIWVERFGIWLEYFGSVPGHYRRDQTPNACGFMDVALAWGKKRPRRGERWPKRVQYFLDMAIELENEGALCGHTDCPHCDTD